MADTPDKKDKRKKSSDEGKKKKSSLKKEDPPREDEVVPQTVNDEPVPESQEEPCASGSEHKEEVEEEELTSKPRRKPSKRSLELEIDEEKLNQLREAFQLFDFNHDGLIDKEDLRKSMISMGKDIQDINEDELDKMMSEACDPLDFDAFIMLLGYRTIELDPEEILKDALSRWDYDGSGLISEEKFRHDLMNKGDKFTEKEVNMALEDAPVTKGFGFYKDIRMIDYIKYCHILCGLRKKTKDPSLEEFGLDVSV